MQCPSSRRAKYQTSFGEFIGIGPNGNLWIEDCDVKELADRFGTPLYLVSESQFRYTYRQFRDAFRRHYPDVEILFANKSNNGLAYRHIMNQEGAGGDCFGVNEMYLALLAGTNPEDARAQRLQQGGRGARDGHPVNGLCINIDAMDELDRIDAICRRTGKDADIGIRLKLDLEPLRNRTGVAMHGPGTLKQQADSTKWGMSRAQTVEHRQARPEHAAPPPQGDPLPPQPDVERSQGLRGDGPGDGHVVRLHPRPHRVDAALHRHRRRLDVREVVRYRAPRAARRREGPDGGGLRRPLLRRHQGRGARSSACRCPKLRMEPGRALSGPSGVAVGRVGAVKQGEKKKWVNLDLSTNHLSWAAVLDWYYHAVPVVNAGAPATESVDLVGPLCNSDEVGPHRMLPPLAAGGPRRVPRHRGLHGVLRRPVQRAAAAGHRASSAATAPR